MIRSSHRVTRVRTEVMTLWNIPIDAPACVPCPSVSDYQLDYLSYYSYYPSVIGLLRFWTRELCNFDSVAAFWAEKYRWTLSQETDGSIRDRPVITRDHGAKIRDWPRRIIHPYPRQ